MRSLRIVLAALVAAGLMVGFSVSSASSAPRPSLASPSYTLVADATLAPWASQVAAAWSKNTGVTMTVGTDCSGPYCIKAVAVDFPCDGGYAGCATAPDSTYNYCQVQVKNMPSWFATSSWYNAFAHESGHCVIGALGGTYGWHASDPKDLMYYTFDTNGPEKRITRETLDYIAALLGA